MFENEDKAAMRTMLAGLAMQAIVNVTAQGESWGNKSDSPLSTSRCDRVTEHVAVRAVQYADALLAELAKEGGAE